MRFARRLLPVALAFSLVWGCDEGKRRRPVEDDSLRLISIEAESSERTIGVPIVLRITVYSAEGERLPGQHVAIESSVESDQLSPDEGVTDGSGTLVAELSGNSLGPRTLTARSGRSKGAVEISLGAPECRGQVLLGGTPSVDQVWPWMDFAIQLPADFDRNGTCDLLWLDVGGPEVPEPTVTVRGAEFTWPRSGLLPPGYFPTAAALGEFAGDGSLGLAVAAIFGAEFEVHLFSHDAMGAWSASGTPKVPAGSSVVALAAADMDGDHRDGILFETIAEVEPGRYEASLHGFEWDDEQGLVEVALIPLGPANTGETAGWLAGDFTGDGRSDVLVQSNGDFSLWRGIGDGTFERVVLPDMFSLPVAAVDLNGDGRLDFVARSWGLIEIGIQTRDGGFAVTPLVKANARNWLRIADLDQDGIPDLWITAMDGTRLVLQVLPGRGDGTFGEAVVSAPIPGSEYLEVCDYWGDGTPSVVVSASWGMTVLPLEKLGSGTSQRLFLRPFAAKAVGDLDGDGKMEIVATHPAGTVRILRPDGEVIHEVSVGEIGSSARVEIGPVGRDPVGSLVVAEPSRELFDSDLRVVSLSTGASQRFGTVSDLRSIAVADLDGDGRQDVVVSANDETYVFFSAGDGFRLEYAAAHGAHALAIGDFDGDRRPDLALLDDDGLDFVLGTEMGTFAPGPRIALEGLDLAAGDLDGDGASELLIGGEDEVIVVRGRDFAARSFPLGGARGVRLTLGELDGDGALDLVIGGGNDYLAILGGDGAGGFLPPSKYPTTTLPSVIRYGILMPGTLGVLLMDPWGEVWSLPLSCVEP